MNQRAKQKAKSRQAITDSAAALLRERGIKASSVMDVMQGAGLTVGGFYNHFDSKEELFVEALRSATSATWNPLLQDAKGDTPRARALSLLRRYLSPEHRDNRETGCLLPCAAPEVAREGEPYRSALEKELSAFADMIAELLEGDPKSRERALGLIALMYGALSLSRAVAGTRLSDEFLRAGKKLAAQAFAGDGEGSKRPLRKQRRDRQPAFPSS
ncbi:MAG: TetR/AcrR family transcriptional regulator [Blastocatellia bacterium]|nr:TetR/AcrR family transcriptional regulator [Blastocatellia bacterium]